MYRIQHTENKKWQPAKLYSQRVEFIETDRNIGKQYLEGLRGRGFLTFRMPCSEVRPYRAYIVQHESKRELRKAMKHFPVNIQQRRSAKLRRGAFDDWRHRFARVIIRRWDIFRKDERVHPH